MSESDRLSALPGDSLRITALLGLAHGGLFVAAFPPINLWPLTLVSVAPLAWLAIHAASGRRAVLSVMAVHLLVWLWLGRWLLPVSAVGYPLAALYLSIFPALFGLIIRAASRHPVVARWPMTAVVPVAWVGVECLRGIVLFDGYPWFLLAHPLIEWPVLAQSADLLGTYFVSFLAAMVAGLVVDLARVAWGQTGNAQGPLAKRRALVATAVVVLAVHAANLVYGLWRVGQSDANRPGPTLLVIQTNLPQENKVGWKIEEQNRDLPRFLEQTRTAHAEAGGAVDLIVWPETMLPGAGLEPETIAVLKDLGEDLRPLYQWGERLAALSRDLGTPILVGSSAWVEPYVQNDAAGSHWEWRHRYNSAYLLWDRPPFQRYDKVFLTPFGETMPYISAWPWLEEKLLALGARGMRFDLDAAPAIKRLELPWTPSSLKPPSPKPPSLLLATPICFEDTVASVCRRMVYEGGRKRAEVLVNLSNDGWFGSYDGGRRQHVQIARWRCIENRVPMVRAVNTGLTVHIDSVGKIVTTASGGRRYLKERTAGSMLAELALDGRRTLYGRLGDAWAWACLALVVAMVGWVVASRAAGRTR